MAVARLNLLKKVSGKFGQVAGLTILSQAVAALSVLAVARNGLNVSDTYALGIQVGTGAFSGYVLGVVYLIAIGRPDFQSWRTHSAIASSFSFILFVVTTALYATRMGHSGEQLRQALPIFASFSLGGIALSIGGVRAVRHACVGNPVHLASNTIIPNAIMAVLALGLSASKMSPTSRALLPAIGWLCAAVINSMRLMYIPVPDTPSLPQKIQNVRGGTDQILLHSLSLTIGVITSTLLPIAYGTAISALRHGALTILFLGTRIGSAAVNVGVNSLLMIRYNWNTSAAFSTRVPRILMSMTLFSSLVALLLYHVSIRTDFELIRYVPIIISWITGIIIAPLLMRHVNVQKMVYHVAAKVAVDLIISSIAALFLMRHPSISGFFVAFTLSQCTTAFVCALALKDRVLQILALLSGLIMIQLLTYGY